MKGKISLFNGSDELLETSVYTNPKDRKKLMRSMAKKYEWMAYSYFIISPEPERLPPTQQVYFAQLFHRKTRKKEEPKLPLIRPLPVYTNSSSPYGIADQLHHVKSNQ